MRIAPLLLLLIGLPLCAPRAAWQISVNVDLVELHATVRDRKGHFAAGLTERDFEIYEQGARQTIRLFRNEDIPATVGLVIDHSGSMRSKMADVISAARTFVRASNPGDQMFVVNFNEHVTMGLAVAGAFSNRTEELESAILNAPVSGQTALYDGVLAALQRLQSGGRDKNVLIVISDGADNVSSHSLTEVLKKAGQSSALIYTIGIFADQDQDRNPRVLRRLAQATGGEAFFPSRIEEVVTVCRRIARDIRRQYTLGYISSNTDQPGVYRAIRVVARAPERGRLSVRTRTGYVTGDAK